MIESLYRETVTLRRPKAATRQVDGSTDYEIVVDEAQYPVRVRCRIERKGRRIFTNQGVELQSDAAMVFRQKDGSTVRKDDIVVDRNGEAWKVLDLEELRQLFGPNTYARAGLQSTVDPVPHDEEVEG
ncbi:MAG: hypothetical protein ACRD1X_12340 [Vicinamibacteria bacterium]